MLPSIPGFGLIFAFYNSKIFSTLAQNPMYIVGIMFMGKKLLKKLQAFGEEEEL